MHCQIDRGNARNGIEIDHEQHQGRGQDDLGHEIDAEPDDDQRCQRYLGNREQAEHHRTQDLGAPRNCGDRDCKAEADSNTERITERHLDQRPLEMPPQRAIDGDLKKRTRHGDRITEKQRIDQSARSRPPRHKQDNEQARLHGEKARRLPSPACCERTRLTGQK